MNKNMICLIVAFAASFFMGPLQANENRVTATASSGKTSSGARLHSNSDKIWRDKIDPYLTAKDWGLSMALIDVEVSSSYIRQKNKKWLHCSLSPQDVIAETVPLSVSRIAIMVTKKGDRLEVFSSDSDIPFATSVAQTSYGNNNDISSSPADHEKFGITVANEGLGDKDGKENMSFGIHGKTKEGLKSLDVPPSKELEPFAKFLVLGPRLWETSFASPESFRVLQWNVAKNVPSLMEDIVSGEKMCVEEKDGFISSIQFIPESDAENSHIRKVVFFVSDPGLKKKTWKKDDMIKDLLARP